ncbi:hypothetical protein [Pseudomonas sp. GD03696]|uniref:hypothetical protein n=1 Tax=Pseudomonas sp. GD03696 TaxID=2975368 RepID=UPI002448758E|nr:hypothetical protein [Pseudomonas sp. GD03696]MDH1930486.1 hypothetical protein [Pseudomonas sp. GD03696]
MSKYFFRADSADPTAPPSLHIRRVLFVSFGGVAFIVFLYGLFLVVKTWPIDEYSISKAGTFGDSFGALNSLFTGLGFAGLLTTIFLQREDLKLTRAELSETRAEIKLQSRTFQQQQFEESFYRLLDLYRENLANLSFRALNQSESRVHGIDAIRARLSEFESACASEPGLSFPSKGALVDKDDYTYWLYKTCNHILARQARYLETLTAIISLIKSECYDSAKAENYLNILSSQFTIYEIKYVFYQAFLNPNYDLLRSIMGSSQSFKDRFSTSSIVADHYLAMDYLWQIKLSQKAVRDDRLFHQENFKAARGRAAQRRQVDRRLTRKG